MFAYCSNNPVSFADESGTAARICLTADVRIDDAPWREYSPGVGGLSSNNYSSGNNYGSVADKFYTARLFKFLFNSDELSVLKTDYFAFYKGVPVVRLPIGNEAFSVGFAIVLGNGVSSSQTVRHEYGHSVHSGLIGMKKYVKYAFIPSLIGYWSGVEYDVYFSQPWEYTAEMIGLVKRDEGKYTYSPWAELLFYLYFAATFVSPG